MNIEDCHRKRMLREMGPDVPMSDKALDMAYEKLNRAVDLKEDGFNEEAVVASYSGMFQAARSLLFREGIIEKNHYCVVLYMKENHEDSIGPELISWLDMYRTERHLWFYGVESLRTNREEAEEAIYRANKFIDRISRLLENKKRSVQEEGT